MDKNLLYLALYEISMSIGNSFDLKNMLNESVNKILSKLNCSAASIYQKIDEQYELLYVKPKVLFQDQRYIDTVRRLEYRYLREKSQILQEQIGGKYFYLFELKNFGYLVLTKSGEPLDSFVVNSLANINLKLLNAIQASMEHTQLQEYKVRLLEAQTIAHLGSWSTSLSSKKHVWDDEVYRIFGEEPQSFEPTYKEIIKRVSSKSRAEVMRAIGNVFTEQKGAYKGKIEVIKKDGSRALVEVQSRVVYDQKGKAVSLVGTTQDISVQHRLEEQLRSEGALLRTVINSVPFRIYWKDLHLNYLGANKLLLKDAHLKNEDQIIGMTDYQMPWKEKAGAYQLDDQNVLNTGIAKLDDEEELHEGDTTKWISTSKVPLLDEEENIFGLLGISHDITSKKEHEGILKSHRDALEYQANHDLLTGLPNRLLFLDRLHQSLYKANRNASKLAVLFLDMDRFKEINDSFGHTFGDKAIKEVARRIKNKIRKSDTIARFGGDEFVMILDDISDPIVMVEVVRKIMDAMSEPIIINDQTLYVTLSIGISIYPDDTRSADNLMKNADAAMYKAKESGRNTYKFYTQEMTKRALERITLESNLRKAIENEDFTLYYQPKVNALANRIIGMEVLIRWEHKTLGFIPPSEFIPIAEETGLIIPLGKWILLQSMKQMVIWNGKGLNVGVLSVNLSMMQLQEYNFVESLITMLQETQCQAKWLELEVTEGQVMKNPEQTIQILEKISNLGIKIAIDDFGTGYSSLSYLKRLPIDILKIDRSFIKDIPYDEEDIAISKGIIALAKSLNIEVIAEGVETEEQKVFLLDNDCIYIQGYLYARPLPVGEIEQMIENFIERPSDTHSFDI